MTQPTANPREFDTVADYPDDFFAPNCDEPEELHYDEEELFAPNCDEPEELHYDEEELFADAKPKKWSSHVKRYDLNKKDLCTWSVDQDLVPPASELKPILFANKPKKSTLEAALSKPFDTLSPKKQALVQEFNRLVKCCESKSADDYGFKFASFTQNSHPYLVLFGQLYERSFANESETYTCLVPPFTGDLLARLYGWQPVSVDKYLINYFAGKADGRYPLQAVTPVNNISGSDHQALRYVSHLVRNTNLDDFVKVKETIDYLFNQIAITDLDLDDLEDFQTSQPYKTRYDRYYDFFGELAGVLSEYGYESFSEEQDFKLAGFDYFIEDIDWDWEPMLNANVSLEDAADFDDEEFPWLVCQGRVFRRRFVDEETSQVPAGTGIKLHYLADVPQEQLTSLDDIDEFMLEHISAKAVRRTIGGLQAVAEFLVDRGWVEVHNSEQLLEALNKSDSDFDESQVEEIFTLFGLLPNGVYGHLPVLETVAED